MTAIDCTIVAGVFLVGLTIGIVLAMVVIPEGRLVIVQHQATCIPFDPRNACKPPERGQWNPAL
jgi:hypothetical protein